MPTYDYICLNCHKKFEIILSYQEYGKVEVICPVCRSEQVRRKIHKVRITRSTESRLDPYSDADLEGMESEPENLGKMMRKMSEEVGEEMPGEFNEVVGRLEKGETPEQIERSMPDLGTDSGDDGDDLD